MKVSKWARSGAVILLSCSIVGCRHSSGARASAAMHAGIAATARAVAPAAANVISRPAVNPSPHVLSAKELQLYKPNEAGVIPILEYHEIGRREHWMSRSIANFKGDLERLYKEGYRPISLDSYLSQRIDLPPGKSPVIITFDDSRGTQFEMRRDGSLDPDCAVAIMKRFHETHPDFPLKATFFVLPTRAFQQKDYVQHKLKALTNWGFDIGNHTVTHRLLHRLSDAQVEREIGSCARLLKKYLPQTRVDTVAFPGGRPPRNRKLIAAGSWNGFRYQNRAGFLAACSPAPSPVCLGQDRLHIQRIVACEGPYGVTFWLNHMRSGAVSRYVSDGDPTTVTVPRKFAARVDRSRLSGAALRIY